MKYVSLDALIDGIGVLATCTNQSQPAKEPAKESVKQIFRRRIQKEKEYASPKNFQFGGRNQ